MVRNGFSRWEEVFGSCSSGEGERGLTVVASLTVIGPDTQHTTNIVFGPVFFENVGRFGLFGKGDCVFGSD